MVVTALTNLIILASHLQASKKLSLSDMLHLDDSQLHRNIRKEVGNTRKVIKCLLFQLNSEQFSNYD